MLDTNVFIGAHITYYAPDFCPAFWDCILQYFHAGRLLSIDHVLAEISKPVGLLQWARNAPNGMFDVTGDPRVLNAYERVINWVHENMQFEYAAKNDFAGKADGWLVAYAQTHNMEVVTHELFQPEAKGRVPIPNVCRQFGVPYLNTFEMLRRLGVQFDLRHTH